MQRQVDEAMFSDLIVGTAFFFFFSDFQATSSHLKRSKMLRLALTCQAKSLEKRAGDLVRSNDLRGALQMQLGMLLSIQPNLGRSPSKVNF